MKRIVFGLLEEIVATEHGGDENCVFQILLQTVVS